MADDDLNEHLLMAMAAEESKRAIHIDFVEDGANLMLELAACEHLEELPDAIVLDLRMPRLDGKRTLEELQTHPSFWRIPVIVFTSSTRVDDETSCYELGAFHFESKPGSFDGMVEFFNRVVDIASRQSIRVARTEANEVISLVRAELLAELEDKAAAVDAQS
jgi:two-component system response regulator